MLANFYVNDRLRTLLIAYWFPLVKSHWGKHREKKFSPRPTPAQKNYLTFFRNVKMLLIPMKWKSCSHTDPPGSSGLPLSGVQFLTTQSTLFLFQFCSGPYPAVLRANSWLYAQEWLLQCPGDHPGCQGSSQHWPHARQIPCPLYHGSSSTSLGH